MPNKLRKQRGKMLYNNDWINRNLNKYKTLILWTEQRLDRLTELTDDESEGIKSIIKWFFEINRELWNSQTSVLAELMVLKGLTSQQRQLRKSVTENALNKNKAVYSKVKREEKRLEPVCKLNYDQKGHWVNEFCKLCNFNGFKL